MDETVQLISNRYLQSETCTKQRNVCKPLTEMTDFSSADASFPPFIPPSIQSTHPSLPPLIHTSLHTFIYPSIHKQKNYLIYTTSTTFITIHSLQAFI